MKIFLTLLFIFNINLFSQEIKDTKTVKDSTVIEEITKDTSTVRDSVAILEGAKEIIQPLQVEAFYKGSTFINRSRITKSDYKSAYDLINLFPNSYVGEEGSMGQYSEFFVYNYFDSEFNIYLKSTNFNLMQSDGIDSIEFIPLTRGFLYFNKSFFESKYINFIESDFLSITPYTRIKYIESSYEGGYVDVILNTLLRKDLNLFVNITNQKTEGRYRNSQSSNWMATARLKYIHNKYLNLIGSYEYSDLKTNINGGVNIDSLKFLPNGEELIFDEVFAPVRYEGFNNFHSHRFNLRTLFQPSKLFKTDIKAYYNFVQNNIKIFDEHKYKFHQFGFNIYQDVDLKITSLKLILSSLSHEVEINNTISKTISSTSYIDFGAILQNYIFDSTIIPSVFFRQSKKLNGIGADILFNFKELSVYSGISWDKDLNAELNIKYTRENLSIKTFFTYNQYDNNEISYGKNLATSGIDFYYKYNFLILELNAGYFFDAPKMHFLPNLKALYGLFYSDKLFKDNLDLKTGFSLYYYNFDKQFFAQKENIFRLDYNFIGIIQESATIYFTMENLLDVNYFLTPYYPMPDRTYRLGVAWEIFN